MHVRYVMLQEKVQIQEARIVDLEKEIKELKNGNEESSKRTMTESRRQEEATAIPLTQTPGKRSN